MNNQENLRFCFIIPCYRHARSLKDLLIKLSEYKIPAVVVDDGNTAEDRALIDLTVEEVNPAIKVKVLHHDVNCGKGYAVATAVDYAAQNGYTHVIQMDSDGQHNTHDVPLIINLVKENTESVISGAPLYDASAPRARVIGRKITNFFVHVETLSNEITDAMIGFRAYPAKITDKIIKKYNIRSRMNFDIEILVRLKWAGTHIRFFNTRVSYPEGGMSNFGGIDNLKISLMHTKLCTLMILSLPYRLLKMIGRLFNGK